jgi:hypothetical protein
MIDNPTTEEIRDSLDTARCDAERTREAIADGSAKRMGILRYMRQRARAIDTELIDRLGDCDGLTFRPLENETTIRISGALVDRDGKAVAVVTVEGCPDGTYSPEETLHYVVDESVTVVTPPNRWVEELLDLDREAS